MATKKKTASKPTKTAKKKTEPNYSAPIDATRETLARFAKLGFLPDAAELGKLKAEAKQITKNPLPGQDGDLAALHAMRVGLAYLEHAMRIKATVTFDEAHEMMPD
jgi:hypothetical protein